MTPELTIFAIPKPFSGHTRIIQENALASWVRLPGVEVLLLGDDEGVADAARRFGVRFEPSLRRTEFGTPLLDSAFEIAYGIAESDRLCYANADIMLFDDLIEAVDLVPFARYLVVAQRTNVDVTERVALEDPVSTARFIRETSSRGVLEPPWASDIFVFPRAVRLELPSFAVGRPGWDNWLIWKARTAGLPVVDVTSAALIVHQNHDYGHVPLRRGKAWEGPEADRNLGLAGDPSTLWTLDRATHVIKNKEVRRARGWRYLRAWLLDLQSRAPWMTGPLKAARAGYRLAKRVSRRSGQSSDGD